MQLSTTCRFRPVRIVALIRIARVALDVAYLRFAVGAA